MKIRRADERRGALRYANRQVSPTRNARNCETRPRRPSQLWLAHSSADGVSPGENASSKGKVRAGAAFLAKTSGGSGILVKTFGRDAFFCSFPGEFPMVFDGRIDFSSFWHIFASRISSQNVFLEGAAETLKCGNVAPARVWAAFAKTQVLRQAGLQAPAFWEARVFPANNAENMKRGTFQSQPLKGRRDESTWKMWGNLESRKAAPVAK